MMAKIFHLLLIWQDLHFNLLLHGQSFNKLLSSQSCLVKLLLRGHGYSIETCQKERQQPRRHLLCCKLWAAACSILIHPSESI